MKKPFHNAHRTSIVASSFHTRDPQTSRICRNRVWVSNRNRIRFLAFLKILLHIHRKSPPWTQEVVGESKACVLADSHPLLLLSLDGCDKSVFVEEKRDADKEQERVGEIETGKRARARQIYNCAPAGSLYLQ